MPGAMDPRAPRFVVVGNPENRRVAFFQDALARRARAPAVVVAYEDLLARRDALAGQLDRGTVVRVESPGENWEVERGLIALGAAVPDDGPASRISHEGALALEHDLGRIAYPRQWYRGYCALLEGLAREIAAAGARVMNAPADVAVMFDKAASHAHFVRHGVAVPPALPPVRSYDELRARMREAGWDRVFVKLAYGSSASGVVAYRASGARELAVTSAELVREGGEVRLYNSLRIRRYTAERDVRAVVDALAAEGVHVEAWRPKARLDGEEFDVRVVTIAGRARHFVVRQGPHPMTNLHLGNRRGDRDAFLALVGEGAWERARATCARAAAAFPRSLYAGVDVLIEPDVERHCVLEINAYGDLLPNVLDAGVDTYTAELDAALEQWERGEPAGTDVSEPTPPPRAR